MSLKLWKLQIKDNKDNLLVYCSYDTKQTQNTKKHKYKASQLKDESRMLQQSKEEHLVSQRSMTAIF